ncbi:tobamovirus multiplication protein 1-like isoform X2 [Phragmites australis]|uniref:tobamovirus multiplication protein 1-like isoform X2 n=1 Tax=Phragmites australis TaxID=29695 RepID=UPI002D76DA63|nr:tobamovirus multiplication protein 1-like isoform X2 [Phragmites australis]
MRKLVSSSVSALSSPEMAAAAGGLALALRGWWQEVNDSSAWQDGAFFSLAAAYAFVSAVALIQLIRIHLRVPEFGWTTQKVFHLMNFIVNGVRAIVFGLHEHVFLLQTKVYTLVLLYLPGLLFFSTYTLLVLFWAEIYHQAKNLPTDKLRTIYIAFNSVIYVIQVCIWVYLGINGNPLIEIVSKVFVSAVSFIALLGFLIYGGRLFVMLRRFPFESKGRRKKLYEVGTVTGICFTCFLIRCIVLTEVLPSALVLFILRKLPPKQVSAQFPRLLLVS